MVLLSKCMRVTEPVQPKPTDIRGSIKIDSKKL